MLSWGPFQNFQQKPGEHSQAGVHVGLQPHILLLLRAQVCLKVPEETPISCPELLSVSFHSPNTGPSRSSSQGPSRNFQLETTPRRPAQIQLRNYPGNLHGPFRAHTQLPPKQISIVCTQPHSCFKLYPITSLSTHPSYYLYQSPTITLSTPPDPTPSHKWAIPGRLGRPHGSHCTCIQGWTPLPGPVPDAVVYPVVHGGLKDIINPPDHISFSSCPCS